MKTLDQKAMLVRLTIRQWTGRKYDKQASHAVEKIYNAQEAGRFNKLLLKKEELKTIQKVANQARIYHYLATLPWQDDGYRILSAKMYFEYTQKIREYKEKFYQVVDSFLSRYYDLIDEAKQRLGDLFNPNDYPKSLDKKFSFEVSFLPIPTAQDFRVELQAEEIKQIKNQIQEETLRRFREAHKDIYIRIKTAVSHMAEKLLDTNAIFRDSLVKNVAILADLIPKLDIMEDKELEDIRNKMIELTKVSPQTLREQEETRKEIGQKAQEIVKMMEGLYGC